MITTRSRAATDRIGPEDRGGLAIEAGATLGEAYRYLGWA
jgi:hypothetical protein